VNNDPSQAPYRSARERYKAAFTENFNIVSLAGAFALSAALLNPIPLLVGLAVEAAYMLFVPDSKWYQSRMKEKFDGEVQERLEHLRDQVFPQIHFSVQEHFLRLQTTRRQISAQSKSEEKWFREALRKLDFLLEKNLHFALKEAEFISYLGSLVDGAYEEMSHDEKRTLDKIASKTDFEKGRVETDSRYLIMPSEQWNNSVAEVLISFYEREIKEILDRSETENVFATKSILEKRAAILTRRKDFVTRIVQILNNLRHQMQLMTDTFGLINDELRARSPEQVLADIDEVVMTSNSLTDAIDSMTPFDQLVSSQLS